MSRAELIAYIVLMAMFLITGDHATDIPRPNDPTAKQVPRPAMHMLPMALEHPVLQYNEVGHTGHGDDA